MALVFYRTCHYHLSASHIYGFYLKIEKIALMRSHLKFAAWDMSDEPLYFDDMGYLRYESEKLVIVTKDLILKDMRILCNHDPAWIAPTPKRFIFQCSRCEQFVKIGFLETLKPEEIPIDL